MGRSTHRDAPTSGGVKSELNDAALRWLMGDARGRRAFRLLRAAAEPVRDARGSGSLMLAGNDALIAAQAKMDALVKTVSFDAYQHSEAEEWHELHKPAEQVRKR